MGIASPLNEAKTTPMARSMEPEHTESDNLQSREARVLLLAFTSGLHRTQSYLLLIQQ